MNRLMIERFERLKKITEGCRDDMHEPDNEGITAIVAGYHLDNAMGDNPSENQGELTVGITRDGKTEWFNLATLIAFARKADLPECKTEEIEVEVYYLKRKYLELMTDIWSVTKKALRRTHVKMPGFKVKFDCTLDDVFALLNDMDENPNPYSSDIAQEFIRRNKIHTSMSVGDVVKMKGAIYICEDDGWRMLE